MLHIASIFDGRKMIIEAFCSVFDLLLDESFHNILKLCSINNVCFNLNHLHASIYHWAHHQHRSVSFLHTFLLSVFQTDNRDKNSSFFWKMYTQAGIDMRFVCYPQPPILTVYLYQSFIYKYFLNYIFLHSESVLKRCILLNPFPNSNMCPLLKGF